MNFLNMHIIHSIPFSNLNRDDAGTPKSVRYGGVSRARLSSQSLKRAARVSLEARSTADRTSRSTYHHRVVMDRAIGILGEQGVPVDDAQLVVVERKAKDLVKGLTSGGDSAKDTVTWLAEDEVNKAAMKAAAYATGVDLEHDFVSATTDSLTIAAFGRMFAARPEVQTEAAVQVAHAFTCHGATTELDFFAAVDDLRPMFQSDSGAAYLDSAEFTSGVFYRYLNIDRDQLLDNWSGSSEGRAQERVRALVQALMLSLPAGRANVTAPHTLPQLILVQEAKQGLSYANAFEAPVRAAREGGFAAPSCSALTDYARRVSTAAGSIVGDPRAWSIDGAGEFVALDDLVDDVAAWLVRGAR